MINAPEHIRTLPGVHVCAVASYAVMPKRPIAMPPRCDAVERRKAFALPATADAMLATCPASLVRRPPRTPRLNWLGRSAGKRPMLLERAVDDWRAIFLCPQNNTASSTAKSPYPPPQKIKSHFRFFSTPTTKAPTRSQASPPPIGLRAGIRSERCGMAFAHKVSWQTAGTAFESEGLGSRPRWLRHRDACGNRISGICE